MKLAKNTNSRQTIICCDICKAIIPKVAQTEPNNHFSPRSFDYGVFQDIISEADIHDICANCFSTLLAEKKFYENLMTEQITFLLHTMDPAATMCLDPAAKRKTK